jgi:3-hydroxybenzoate 6-monooxygenase
MTAANGHNLPILVAGGGIGGLVAAYALARQGLAVRVLEQAGDFREVGAGIQLGPNVFRALDRIGLKDAVLRDAWRPPAQEMRCALSGRPITAIPLGEAYAARFQEPYAVTHRTDLHAVLLDACRSHPLVSLETARRVESFTQDADGVAVALQSGEQIRGCALIGCDGLWSRIRERVIDDGPPRVSGHIAYRAVLRRQDVPDDLWRPDVVLWAGPRTHFVHYPLRRGELFNLVAVFHSDRYVEGWNSEGDPAELMLRFRGQRPEVLRLLERIETWRMWVLCDREPVRDWSSGRAPAWRSRMRCASANGWGRRPMTLPVLSGPIRRRAICAPAGCRSWPASTVRCIMRLACRRSCATRCWEAARRSSPTTRSPGCTGSHRS